DLADGQQLFDASLGIHALYDDRFFLSLALPIEVGGTFQKFSISPTAVDVLGMVGRLATSIVWVPIQKLSGRKIPADGADVCSAELPD
ncbi:MAG: hypothetical protein ACK5VP_00995, partial [Betaproteobacteria bacterium]